MKYVFCLIYGTPQGETERRLIDVCYMDKFATQELAEKGCEDFAEFEKSTEYPMDCEFVIRDHRY